MVKIEHGDDLIASLKTMMERESLEAAAMVMIGAVNQTDIVVGPKEPAVPPDPVWRQLTGGHEIAGIATGFWDGQEAVIHLHAAVGHGEDVIVGCIRNNAEVYLVLEVIVFEICGTDALRVFDPLTQLRLLRFGAL